MDICMGPTWIYSRGPPYYIAGIAIRITWIPDFRGHSAFNFAGKIHVKRYYIKLNIRKLRFKFEIISSIYEDIKPI